MLIYFFVFGIKNYEKGDLNVSKAKRVMVNKTDMHCIFTIFCKHKC